MPMPSLLKYFAFMGVALFGLLSLANFLLDPSTGATPVASVPAKRALVVQHDPRASKIERWRDEQAALKAADQTPVSQTASVATKSTPEPTRAATLAVETPAAKAAPAPQPAQASQPVQPSQPVQAAPVQAASIQTAAEPAQPAAASVPASDAMVGVETAEEAAASAKAEKAERKAKVAKAKARKDRQARERALAQGDIAPGGQYAPRERFASSQQDQYYYAQRAAQQQQQQFQTRYSSAYTSQPQQSFGPFGGWGRGW